MNYYNENDKYAAEWLRNLIADGQIPAGEVDTRSISDVRPSELSQYVQCHFFAGVGGWSLALRLAGWPDSQRIWTGSCPCQPFSQAGKGAGVEDERHLWPDWIHLIRQCKPPIIFGEQVASAIRVGWLDTVFDDLQHSGYACGAANLPAAGVGAPHLRERVWFVGALAVANSERGNGSGNIRQGGRRELADSCGLGNASSTRLAGRQSISGNNGAKLAAIERASNDAGAVGVANSDRCQPGHIATTPSGFGGAAIATNWDAVEWLACIDGKSRPTEPGLSPLAHGIPASLGSMLDELSGLGIDAANAKRLAKHAGGLLRSARAFRSQQIRGYGNAIVPQVAAEFIRSLMQ